MGGLLTATAIYALSSLLFGHLVEAGANIIQHTIAYPCVPGTPPLLAFLMGVKGSNSHLTMYFHITAVCLSVLFMIGSDIFVRFSRHSQPTPANAPTTIVNTIPFSTLNTSIALTIVVNVILHMFGVTLVMGVHATLIMATLLLTNKRALNHLRLRLRQNFDSLSIGRSNRVVSIALVPIRDFRA